MFRLLMLAALLSAVSAPGHSQDSQSLGDVARQVRSQRGTAQPKRVITNDDLPSTSTGAVLGLGTGGDPASLAKPGAESSALASLTRWESVVKKINSIDRATLLKLALQGASPNFPGYSEWEARLLEAKNAYVAQGMDLTERARRLLESAEALKNAQATADDPRAKELANNLKELVREAVTSDAEFQAVILEGRDLAHRAQAQ